jgi:hypothetical protein
MIKAIIPAAFALACAAPAQAACSQADIAGRWTAYSFSQDQTGSLAWAACVLNINAQGQFTAGPSYCSASGQTVQIHGALTTSAASVCLFSGSITSSQNVTDPIPSITLSLDKQSAMGAGGKNGTGGVFMFSMVRTK